MGGGWWRERWRRVDRCVGVFLGGDDGYVGGCVGWWANEDGGVVEGGEGGEDVVKEGGGAKGEFCFVGGAEAGAVAAGEDDGGVCCCGHCGGPGWAETSVRPASVRVRAASWAVVPDSQ